MSEIIEEVRDDEYIGDIMAWASPLYDRETINSAAKELITQPWLNDEGYEIINNWRSSHNFPLNTFQIGLRRKAKGVDSKSVVAQRIKRLSSIGKKLKRFEKMKLTQMQDIAGCRAIVGSISQVNKLVGLYKKSSIKHKLVGEKNYIHEPKETGYRGVHLIYSYYSDRNETYNGLKVEIQIRTLLQHAWATAVETVDTFTRQSLKSSQGGEDWLRFFELMGTAIANREKTPIIPNTPNDEKVLRDELIHYENELQVRYHLKAWGDALKDTALTGAQDASYYLLELDSTNDKLSIVGYSQSDLSRASNDYLKLERSIVGKNADAVLVSVESLEALRRAYPNYYLDTNLFMEIVEEAIK